MSSSNNDLWERLKGQLGAAARVPFAESRISKNDHGKVSHGFTRCQVNKVSAFIFDVCGGDSTRAIAYAERFEKTTDDRIFARAVRVAVEKKLKA
jgi:hypothetical protein